MMSTWIKISYVLKSAVMASIAMLGLGLLSASETRAQMPVALHIQGDRVGAGRTAEAVYRIQIGAGQSGASFGFEYILPPWPTPGFVKGSPITITGVILKGPGAVRPAVRYLPKPSLEYEENCQRFQPSPYATSYWVDVPPGLSAEVELRGRASYPGWPGTRYDVAFSTFQVDDPIATRNPLQEVSVPFLGARGTHISMHSVAAASSSVKRGRMTPEIVGRTNPPLRHARIRLRAVRPPKRAGGRVSLKQWSQAGSASVKLRSVRTDGQGKFRLSPQSFPYFGRYAILARSQPKGGIAADWNCGPFFDGTVR